MGMPSDATEGCGEWSALGSWSRSSAATTAVTAAFTIAPSFHDLPRYLGAEAYEPVLTKFDIANFDAPIHVLLDLGGTTGARASCASPGPLRALLT